MSDKGDRGSKFTIQFEYKIYDPFVGYSYADPTNPLFTVTDPNGEDVVTATAPTKFDTGRYYAHVQTDTDWIVGTYTVSSTTDDADVTIKKKAFKLT